MSVLEKISVEYNLTPSEMAKKLDITEAYYSMLVNGKRPISKALAIKIKDTFGVSLDEIFLRNKLTK